MGDEDEERVVLQHCPPSAAGLGGKFRNARKADFSKRG